MPRAKRGVNVLPAPTWTRSDNNLLHKWLKYLKWQRGEYGTDGIRQAKDAIAESQREVNTYDGYARDYNTKIANLKDQITKLKKKVEPTDAEIMQKYEALIASPHVIGTRIDSQGALVALIDPQLVEGKTLEFGMYEVDVRSLSHGRHQIVLLDKDRTLLNLIYSAHHYQDEYYGKQNSLIASISLDGDAVRAIDDYDLLPAVENLVDKIQRLYPYNRRYGYNLAKKSPTRNLDQPWSGFVEDPVRALRRLRLMYGTQDVASQIKDLQYSLRSQEVRKKGCLDDLRALRKQLRDQEAELAKLEATTKKDDIDLEEAARSLEFISTLPTVIAIKFDPDGIPVIHVRNTFVRGGNRYDLGDFEIRLVLEHKRFGDVAKVRRTRCPLGGSYNQGWHPDDNAFCFGNRTSEMRDAFYAGDLNHAFNLILGTMNEIDADHDYRVREGMFAEIAMDDVWQRKPRRRVRHKPTTPPEVAPEVIET